MSKIRVRDLFEQLQLDVGLARLGLEGLAKHRPQPPTSQPLYIFLAPGAVVLSDQEGHEHEIPLKGKPWRVLEAFRDARRRRVRAYDLWQAIWEPEGKVAHDLDLSPKTVTAAIKVVNDALKRALRRAKVSRPQNPISCVDRGRNLAWELSLELR